MEVFMANWEDIKASVSRATNKTIKKAGELADTASLHFKLKTLKVKQSEKFEKLGKLTYKQLKAELDMTEEIAKMVADIDAVKSDISAQKAKIEQAKADKAKAKEEQKKAKAEAEAKADEECVAEVKVIIESNK